MKLRVLAIDDEPLARERLRQMLAQEAEVEIIGECADGAAAVEAIPALRPDLIFLDIRMPGLDGFEVLEALAPEHLPWTIFLTAYDQHAVRAFEARALDYLLKPVAKDRLAAALVRARERLRTAGPVPALQEWLAERESARRLVVRDGARVAFVPVASVIWIESAGNYVILHTAGASHILRETLNALEKRLPGELFLRISRAAIVNVRHVNELQCAAGQCHARLSNDRLIHVTRSRDEIAKRQS